MKRRDLLRDLGGVSAALATAGVLTACNNPSGDSDSALACEDTGKGPVYDWKMVTAWPKDFPALGTGANNFANNLQQLSGGRIRVRVYGGGELVPPFEVFDAVSSGAVELGHSASYYWKGKVPAAQFFAGVPFGLTGQEQNGWLYYGGGMELWRELYAAHNLVPFAIGNSGTQMGGWFNREINSREDLRGLKMRIPGLGGEVLARAGGTPVSIPGSEIFTALQTGVIDATEWIGPYNDLAFGLFRAAPYYYTPGWQEPGSTLEAMINRDLYEGLPEDLQAVIEVAARAANLDMLCEFTARNGSALKRLVDEHQVELRQFPQDVLDYLKSVTTDMLEEMANADSDARRVYDSFLAYSREARPWTELSEKVFMNTRGDHW